MLLLPHWVFYSLKLCTIFTCFNYNFDKLKSFFDPSTEFCLCLNALLEIQILKWPYLENFLAYCPWKVEKLCCCWCRHSDIKRRAFSKRQKPLSLFMSNTENVTLIGLYFGRYCNRYRNYQISDVVIYLHKKFRVFFPPK